MSVDTDRIKKAITTLSSDAEREEIKKFVDDFNRQNLDEQKRSKKEWEVKNFSVGPTSSASCPCCGK